MKTTVFYLLAIVLLACSNSNELTVTSPNGNIIIKVSDESDSLKLSAVYDNEPLITSSPLGLKVDGTDLTSGVVVEKVSENEFDETWNTVNGKQRTVRNHYKELKLKVQKKDDPEKFYEIILRVYNDGFAYRYNFPEKAVKENVLVEKELTTLNFADDFTYWAYNIENNNIGPVLRSATKRETELIPMVMKFNDHRFMAIHEAEIVSFAPFTLNTAEQGAVLGFNVDYSPRAKAFRTSWRTFIVGKRAGDLVESDLLVNLNPPCKIEDPSWVKPGKVVWDWRVWGYKAKDGFEYGLNTVSHKRLIDFASANNIQYLLIDADWYGDEFNENSDPTSSRKGINITECMAYAKKKNVGVILYLNDIGAKKFGLERVLKQFADWGAVGVKYGFMTGSWEDKVKHTREVVELCAKYKLMVDFHDNPVPPSGDRRTYPNLMTKEFGHSQADAMKSYFPEKPVTSNFVNMIAGPLDMCNGWFDLNNAHSRVRVFKEIPGTVASEVAKLIVVYTGWAVLPDSPEEYLKKDDLFDCIRKMPPGFDSFRVLDGNIGEFITVARAAGDDWFIGSLTNRDAREIVIDLSFLPEGKQYEATIYGDAPETHYLKNKEAYRITKQNVDRHSKLNVWMAPGGGNAIYLKQK